MKAILGILLAVVFVPGLAFSNNQIDIRIVGGSDAQLNEFPSTVSVQYRSRHFCGGTLIAQQWVLSAAHCWDGLTPNRVVIGAVDLNNSQQGEAFDVDQVIVHPNFGQASPISSDYALIKLKEPVINHPIAKLNDVEPDDIEGASFTVVGWGATSEGGFTTTLLQKVEVPLVDRQTCNQNILDFDPEFGFSVDEMMFCAGIPEGGKDACQGDSGGPIYLFDDATQQYKLMGVVSWGIGCVRPNLPGIYSDISEALEWIDQVIVADRFLKLSSLYNF